MSALDAGVAGSRFLRLLLKQNEVVADEALGKVYHLLAELGYFVKRGDKYKRTSKIPPATPSRVIGSVFDDVIIPHLLGEQPKINNEAIFAATAVFQALRAKAAARLGRGTLALVAGWLPCGFSTEISAATGADLVILDEHWEILALEEERVSILPLELERIGEDLSPTTYISFEVGRLEELPQDKYGTFTIAVTCHRAVDTKKLQNIAERVYRVHFYGPPGIFASLIADALNLGRPEECGKDGKIVFKDHEVCMTQLK